MLAKTLFRLLKKEGIEVTVLSTSPVNGTKYEARNNNESLIFNVNDQDCCDYVRAFRYDDRFSFAENYDRGVYARTAKEAIAMLTA
jgi:hypothetical protein